MGALSIWHWAVVAIVIAILFLGGPRVSSFMGDFGNGIRLFKKSIRDENA